MIRTPAEASLDGKRIEMRSERRVIPATVERVLAAVRPVGLPSDRLSDLAVAVSEALSNAAIHGNGLDPEKTVVITVHAVPGDRAVIEVQDHGHGFDVARLSDPTDPAQVLAPSGRGVFLMRRLVDRLEYEDGGSRVRLTVGRRRASRRTLGNGRR
ncbi:MAG TPA: ATP-binding protein [Vicinamibacteria bacterium]|nr:ATP-binding protein [Vicinamibacteria bacterium]